MDQWRERLALFLGLTTKDTGQIGGGRITRTGCLDVAVIQSLIRKGDVKDLVAEYGQLIVDECHPVSAFSFERVLRKVKAKYVLGLTATPIRKDGHHPIILMQCGPIRFNVNSKRQAAASVFRYEVVPRLTTFSIPPERNGLSIQDIPNSNLFNGPATVTVRTLTITPGESWAGLGYAHRTLSLYSDSESTRETYNKSIEAINKALAFDQNLSEAHSALCENKYLFEWDFAGAEPECKLAIQLDSNSSQAHEIYSRYLMGRGRHEEALAEIKTAIDLEPTSKFNQQIFGRVLFYARRYREAEDQFKRVIAMDQNWRVPYKWLTSTLALQGNEADAFDWFMKLLSLRKVEEETIQVFKSAFQRSGWHGVSREWVKRFDEVGGAVFERGAYSAQIGDKDKAFEYLEQVYQRREVWNTYLRVDPRLDPLRDDPRFADLLRRVESN